MKKILVLTDFSANADHAAQCAQVLAQRLHRGILLFHAVQSMPIVPNYAGGAFVTETENLFAEESRERLSKLKDRMLSGNKGALSIDIRNGEGDLGSNVKQILHEQDIEMIVMGAPEGGLADHLLTGSETRSVISSADRPVLVIPAQKTTRAVNNFALATDYRAADLSALRYLSNWIDRNGGRLDVVHIQTPHEVSVLNAQQREVFEFFLARLNDAKVHCHDLRGNAVLERLNRFCADKKVDVLAMINYHHNFFSRLLGTSQTFKALQHLQIPVLVFPGSFNDEMINTM